MAGGLFTSVIIYDSWDSAEITAKLLAAAYMATASILQMLLF